MEYSTNNVNVIWADDEYASLRDDMLIRKFFDMKHIKVLRFVGTSDELYAAISRYYDRIDAIIIDGNFSRKGELNDVDDGIDISGLVHTVSFIDSFNQKREIPFYLYTGKKTKIQEMCKHIDLLTYFKETNRIIQKGEVELLANSIIKDVEHIRSVENWVTRRYSKVLDMAAKVDYNPETKDSHTRDLLHSFLLAEARDINYDKAESMFANLRKILEWIASQCKELGMVPEALDNVNNKYTLNYFAKYWSYKNMKYGKKLDFIPIDDNVMPPSLSSIMKPMVDIIQDGSHAELNNLYVSDYVAASQTPYLFRMALHFVLNTIQWFNEAIDSERTSFYKRNPYLIIRKEWNEKSKRYEFRYMDMWFDRGCLPSDREIGKFITIKKTEKKTIKEFEIIE